MVLPKFLQKYLSQGLRIVPKFIIVICYSWGEKKEDIFLKSCGVPPVTIDLPEDSLKDSVDIYFTYVYVCYMWYVYHVYTYYSGYE